MVQEEKDTISMLQLKYPVLTPSLTRAIETRDDGKEKKKYPIYIGHTIRDALQCKIPSHPPTAAEETERFVLSVKISRALTNKTGESVETPFTIGELATIEKAIKEFSEATIAIPQTGEKMFLVSGFVIQQVLCFLKGTPLQPEEE